MGFCLFEEVNEDGYYMAVNPACVDDIELAGETNQGWPVSKLVFSFITKGFDPYVLGDPKAVRDTLMQGVKIGMGTLTVRILVGQENLKEMPTVLNKPNSIALIKETHPFALGAKSVTSQTASYLVMDDGLQRPIADRPGLCAYHINAEGRIPQLNIRSVAFPGRYA